MVGSSGSVPGNTWDVWADLCGNSDSRGRMSAGHSGHMTGQMGHVHGTDGTHNKGCPAQILCVYWVFLCPSNYFGVIFCKHRPGTKCTEHASQKIRRSKRLELYIFQKRPFKELRVNFEIFKGLVVRAIRNAIRANRFARIIRH